MMPRPFLIRLLVPFGALLILIVLFCGAVMYRAGEASTRRQELEDLHRLATLVNQWESTATTSAWREPGPADRARLMDASRVLGTRITLIDGSGQAVFDTDSRGVAEGNHNNFPEVIE